MPIINNALVAAGYESINSIVTTFDSGGDTGRMRTDERGRIMAFSDYWRALISLWRDSTQKELWLQMLRFRDGRGRNFGNSFFQFMAEKSGGLHRVDDTFIKLTGADLKGRVIPVALKPAEVMFSTISGKNYSGEHNLDDLRMSKDRIGKIWLKPHVPANPEAIEVIGKADVIIFCPGSMYGSVIVNLLPKGIKEALGKNKGKKILMTNIMSMANENDGFDQGDYVGAFEKYLGKVNFFDLVVMADLNKLDQKYLRKALGFYAMENSLPIKYNNKYKKTKTILGDIAVIEELHMRLRHSENKLSTMLTNLIE